MRNYYKLLNVQVKEAGKISEETTGWIPPEQVNKCANSLIAR
jgi:hypothetical protein